MLCTQTIAVLGFMGPMVMPLLIWILTIPHRSFVPLEASNILVGGSLLSLAVFYSGVAVFLVSLVQWFWYRHKQDVFFTKGLYSKIRHPQFLGIILISLGITLKLMPSKIGWGLIGIPFYGRSIPLGMGGLIGLWFLQVLGYVAFAYLEERSLSRRLLEFNDYKQKVPLLLPMKSPRVIPEAAFTVMVFLAVCVVLFLLPYNSIRWLV